MAMERDIGGATSQVNNQAPRLRGRPMPRAVLDQSSDSLALLAEKFRMTAQALLKTASLALDLSAAEDMVTLEEAKNQVLRAAQVAESLGDDAADDPSRKGQAEGRGSWGRTRGARGRPRRRWRAPRASQLPL